MSQQPPNRLPESLTKQLREFRGGLRRVRILELICVAGLFVLVSYLCLFCIDRFWDTPAPVITVLVAVVAACLLFLTPYVIIRWIWRRRSHEQLATLIAQSNESLGDRLLGIIELNKHERRHTSVALQQAATAQVASEVARHNLAQHIPRPRHKQFALFLLVFALIAAGLYLFSPEAALNTWQRWSHPISPPERYTFVQLEPHADTLIVPFGEPVQHVIKLKSGTKSKPDYARYTIGALPPQHAALQQDGYTVTVPPLQEPVDFEFSAGDTTQRFTIVPKNRPSLVRAQAHIEYPAYMARESDTEPMRAGVIAAPLGARVNIRLEASQTLRTATDSQGNALAVDGKYVTLGDIPVTQDAQTLELRWTDRDGLTAKRPVQVQLRAIEDMPPTVFIRDANVPHTVLQNASIPLDLAAQDDLAVQYLGIEWQPDQEQTEQTPAQERILEQGTPQQAALEQRFLFQPDTLGISPQRIRIRAFAQDFNPNGKRVYSEPLWLTVLSHEEHAAMIKQELDRLVGELEDLTRNMDSNADEAERLAELPTEQLAQAANKERLESIATQEQTDRRQAADLLERAKELFAEASKNDQLQAMALKDMMQAISTLTPVPQGSMQQAQQHFQQAANTQNTQQAQQELNAGKQQHQAATEAVKQAIEQLSQSSQNLEASTFVARLKQAADQEDAIAGALGKQIQQTVGRSFQELDPALRRDLEHIAKQQRDSTQNIAWILEDLGYYKARTDNTDYTRLFRQMTAFSLREKLETVHDNILRSISARSIDESRHYAATLRQWAQLLDHYQKQQQSGGGGGGGGGGNTDSLSDQDFEFLLKLARMIQQEQEIRARTRTVETTRRKTTAQPAPVPNE